MVIMETKNVNIERKTLNEILTDKLCKTNNRKDAKGIKKSLNY